MDKQSLTDKTQFAETAGPTASEDRAGHSAAPGLPEACGPTLKLDSVDDAKDEAVGTSIGRYKLLESLGEGGCGVVYVAEQTEPVRRRVALKVIKLGMDSKAVVARFEAERQALAMMDHPNIAKVLDAGTTERGRPYFVMELVRGIPITDYCDQNRLPIRERLDLFIHVCQAIQHAHQKGIIHRDIKPSNILVTLHDGAPVPKVIDFGIAKATEGRLTDSTVYTQLHQFIGTPAYMSPEQAEMSGLDIDTRSDIYSLGVLLYELLTGQTPLDGRELISMGLDGLRKTIREKEPVRPSTKLDTLKGEELTATAKRHGVDGPKLVSQLRGDLDWIVMKCLEKDRTRRYETASAVAMDIRRHLGCEPVLARPPSRWYEFQKTVRRHKAGFGATAAIILVLAGGVATSSWQAMRATKAQRAALAAREQAEANENKAITAQASEARLKDRALAQELISRRNAYAGDMNLARAALASDNLGGALSLIERHQPRDASEPDLRGWEWRYLWGQGQGDEEAVLWKGTNNVRSAKISHDGKLAAISEARPGSLHVIDVETRRRIADLPAFSADSGAAVSFSPTDLLLAYGHETNGETSVCLWDGRSKEVIGKLPLEAACRGLSFAADGRRLVTLSQGTNGSGSDLRVWQIPEGRLLENHRTELRSAYSLGDNFAAASDLSMAAFGVQGNLVQVIDLRRGEVRWSAVAAKEIVLATAISPDASVVATGPGYTDATIRLWSAEDGREIAELKGHSSLVLTLKFLPDGKTLASGSADQTIRLWDLSRLPEVPEPRVLRGHRSQIWTLESAPDGRRLISASLDGTARSWDTASEGHRRGARTLPVRALSFGFLPDGRSLFTFTRTSRLMRWQGPDFENPEEINLNLEPGFQVASAALSKDCRWLAVSAADGEMLVYDVARRTRVARLQSGLQRVRLVAFQPGERSLLFRDGGKDELKIWAFEQGTTPGTWPVARGYYWVVGDFLDNFASAQGPVLTVGRSGAFLSVDPATGAGNERDLGIEDVLESTLSHDGKLMALSTLSGSVHLLETKTLRKMAVLGQLRLSVNDSVFAADDQRLITASTGSEAVRVWDLKIHRDLLTLEVDALLARLRLSPGEEFLAGMDLRGGVHIWRAPSWEEIATAEERARAAHP